MRALLLKPAALGAAVGLALFGIAVLLVSSLAAHASVADSSSSCASVPTSATVLTSSNNGATSATTSPTTLSTGAVVVPADSSSSGDSSPSTTDTPGASDSSAADTPASSNSTGTSTAASSDGTSSDPGSDQTPATDPGSSASATSSTSPSPSPVPQLCVLAQSYPSSGDVLAGDPASYVVRVWSTVADATSVTVTASVTAASYLGSPSFSICPSATGATCTIASLPVGQAYELLASVPVTSDAAAGTDIELTVTATATGDLSGSSNATDDVVTPTAAASSGSGSDTSAGAAAVVPPLISLPPIPGTGVTATNPSNLFPTVSPSPSSGSLGLPPAQARRVTHATEAAYASVPVDPRLLGAQIIGLVALAGAVTIAVLRLSLRKPQLARPAPGAEPTDPPTASS